MMRVAWMRALVLLGFLTGMATAWASAPIGDVRFSMVDQDGKAVTEALFDGSPTLLYFGFTSCPDVCPTDLAKMAAVVAQVQREYGTRLRPVFVTVDPERDTPASLKGYVKWFSPDFVGLTGSPAQVADIARQYHVFYRKVPISDRGHYTMDHSTFLFLLDDSGKYVAHFGRKMEAPQIVSAIGARRSALMARPR